MGAIQILSRRGASILARFESRLQPKSLLKKETGTSPEQKTYSKTGATLGARPRFQLAARPLGAGLHEPGV